MLDDIEVAVIGVTNASHGEAKLPASCRGPTRFLWLLWLHLGQGYTALGFLGGLGVSGPPGGPWGFNTDCAFLEVTDWKLRAWPVFLPALFR